jgi:microcin C transport system permease protein
VSSSIEPPAGRGAAAGRRRPARARSLSPRARWLRFRRNRLGFWSLVMFCVLVVLSLFAELLSNDKPLVVRYEGQFYFPVVKDYPETTFGGDFPTPADYLDPFIQEQHHAQGRQLGDLRAQPLRPVRR